MSRELLDEYIDKLVEEEHDVGSILEELVEYGFADENDLCRVLETDSQGLDHLMNCMHEYDDKQVGIFRKQIIRYLKRIRKTYEKHYYSDDE